MKKRNTGTSPSARGNRRGNRNQPDQTMNIGIDLGDRTSRYCVIDQQGDLVEEGKVATTREALAEQLSRWPSSRIAIEVGAHSRWVSQWLESQSHQVWVANARQLKLISASSRKDDRMDARTLARLVRLDPQLLRPIRHRSQQAQQDLMTIRVRATLVEARTALINAARGLAKSAGERLPKADADQMGTHQARSLPEWLKQTLRPLLEEVESLTRRIRECDQQIERLADTHAETALLRQVWGVGTLISLTFVLTLEDRERFRHSRDVGCYLGLRPKRSDSGERSRQLRITKEGDRYLRQLLVQGAHCVIRQRAPDSDLKRWGRKLAGRGGRNGKKRAIVAVARKLAVLLHRLWATGEVYEPLRNTQAQQARRARRQQRAA